MPTSSPTEKPSSDPVTSPTVDPSTSPTVYIKKQTVIFKEGSCSDICGRMVQTQCLPMVAEDMKKYLGGKGVMVETTVACGSIIVELEGSETQVNLGVSVLSNGCATLERFGMICGPVEVPGLSSPTVFPTLIESDAVETGTDDNVVFEFMGYAVTQEYVLYAMAVGVLLVCCLCCCIGFWCCRCQQRAKEKRKSKTFNEFFSEFQATPMGTASNYADQSPLPPAPVPAVGRWARRRSSGLGQLVSESFADIPRQRSEGSFWEENLAAGVASTYDDGSELNIYGSFAHGREPGVSIDAGASWHDADPPNADIFRGSHIEKIRPLDRERRVSNVSDLSTPQSTPGGGFSFYPGLGGEASYVSADVREASFQNNNFGGARSPSEPELMTRPLERRPSVIDGNVVPPAPISPRRSSMSRRSSETSPRLILPRAPSSPRLSQRSNGSSPGFELARAPSAPSSARNSKRRSSFFNGIDALPPTPTSPDSRRSSVARSPHADSRRNSKRNSLPFIRTPRSSARKGTLSRAETSSTVSSNASSPVRQRKKLQGESSFDDINKLLHQTEGPRPPTGLRFYENNSVLANDMSGDIITEDDLDGLAMDGGGFIEDTELALEADSERDSVSFSDGGAAFEDDSEPVEINASAPATFYENSALLAEESEEPSKDMTKMAHDPKAYSFTKEQRVEYSVNGIVWNIGEITSTDPVRVKGEGNWISREYPFVRPYVEERKRPSVAAQVSLAGADAIDFLRDMSDLAAAAPASPTPPAPKSPVPVVSPPARRMPEVNMRTGVPNKRMPMPSFGSPDTSSALTATYTQDTNITVPTFDADDEPERKRAPSLNHEAFLARKRSNRVVSAKRDMARMPRAPLPSPASSGPSPPSPGPSPPIKKRDVRFAKEPEIMTDFTAKRKPMPLSFGKRDAAKSGFATSVEDSMDLQSSPRFLSYDSQDTLQE